MILGIDPGKQGAFVLMTMDGKIEWIRDFPKEEKDLVGIIEVASFHNGTGDVHVFIERVHAQPGNGLVQAFSFGRNYGLIHGVLLSYSLYPEYVQPVKWQRAAGIMKADKKVHCSIAAKAWGGVDFYGVKGGLKDGRADAAFIASYGIGIIGERKRVKYLVDTGELK